MIAIRNTRDGTGAPTIVLYGPPGAGKTTFATSFPRPVVLDFDRGLRSVAATAIDYIPCVGIRDANVAMQTLERHLASYDTIVVDSLTELVHQAIGDGADAGSRSLAAWGRVTQNISAVIRRLRRTRKTIVITALSREDRIDESTARIRPALPRQLAVDLTAAADLVLHLGPVRDPAQGFCVPVVTTKDTGRVYAKDRSGLLPLRMRAVIEPLRAAGFLGTVAPAPSLAPAA